MTKTVKLHLCPSYTIYTIFENINLKPITSAKMHLILNNQGVKGFLLTGLAAIRRIFLQICGMPGN